MRLFFDIKVTTGANKGYLLSTPPPSVPFANLAYVYYAMVIFLKLHLGPKTIINVW